MRKCLQRRPVSRRIRSMKQGKSTGRQRGHLSRLGDGRYGQGYAAAAKRYIVRAVCAVGMAQPGAQGKILRERNKLPESVPLFQLQGNFDVKSCMACIG